METFCTPRGFAVPHLSGRREEEAMSWDDAILSTCDVMRGGRHDMAGDLPFHTSRVDVEGHFSCLVKQLTLSHEQLGIFTTHRWYQEHNYYCETTLG